MSKEVGNYGSDLWPAFPSVPLLDIRLGKQEVAPLLFLQGRGSPKDAAQVSGFFFLC